MSPVKKAAALVLATIGLAGCFEPAVTESIEIVFTGADACEVRIDTRIAADAEIRGNRTGRERGAALREEIRAGSDGWTRQLEAMAPDGLRRTVVKTHGEIRERTLAARLADPEALRRLFEPAPLWVSFRREARTSTFEIVPGRDSRASAADARRVERALAGFSAAVSAYLGEASALWRRLDLEPERARPVMRKLLSPPLAAEGEEAELTEEEEAAIEKLGARMEVLLGYLRPEGGAEESLDDVARRVFDPFPAPVTVAVPGAVVEVEGFVPAGDGRYAVPTLSLLGALEALGGQWVGPDPFLAAIGRRGEGATLQAFLEEPRVAKDPPASAAVNEAVRARLRSAPVYRLRFSAAK